jgi:hypothetical protein
MMLFFMIRCVFSSWFIVDICYFTLTADLDPDQLQNVVGSGSGSKV